jgi:predicted metal-dependent enzyme (double-stranded beta helix superfamily)
MPSRNSKICKLHHTRQESQASDEYQDRKVMRIKRSDRLRRNVQRVCELNESVPGYRHYKEINEYLTLATQPTLSNEDMKQLEGILDLGYQNAEIGDWIEKIDDAVEQCSARLSVGRFEDPKLFLNLKEFLYEIEKNHSENITLENFENLVAKIDLDEETINSNLGEQDNAPYKKIIYQSSCLKIFIMTWKPGQRIRAHKHQNDLSIIQVYKGYLSHKHWENFSSKGAKCDVYEQELLGAGQSTSLGFFDHHELANESNDFLVTIHFRYSKQSLKPIESSESIDKTSNFRRRTSVSLSETIKYFFR